MNPYCDLPRLYLAVCHLDFPVSTLLLLLTVGTPPQVRWRAR